MSNENKKVSIVIPCYNQAQYLSETLNSVLEQTYVLWECIIVNDGSLDNSEEIALEYCRKDSRFRYYYKSNSGPSDTRNQAIRYAIGEFILPLDADDIISPTYIEKAVNYFILNPSTKLVYCQANLFGEVNEFWDLPPYNFDEMLIRNHIFCSAMFRRLDFENTSGYNTNMVYGYEDWDFWISFLTPNDHVYRIEEVLFYYRIKEVSRSTELSSKELKMREMLIYNHPDKYLYLLEKLANSMDYKQKYTKIINSCEYRIGKKLLKPFLWIKRILLCK